MEIVLSVMSLITSLVAVVVAASSQVDSSFAKDKCMWLERKLMEAEDKLHDYIHYGKC
nr:MAG TPA: hypothetical protein [Caudoviricetes sp.]